MTTVDTWRETRRSGLGGSDIAAIMGLSPYASPWSVWADKVLDLPDEPDDDLQDRFDVGHDAEPYLAAQFHRHTGLTVERHQIRLGHPDHPWAMGHADGLAVDADGDEVGGWEGKTARDLKPWDEVPVYYQCQVQWYMWLTGLPRWYVTVGFASWQCRTYTIERDEDDIAAIVTAAERFWAEHVVTGEPPVVDDHPATTGAIKRAYATPDADDITWADPDALAAVDELRAAKDEAKQLDARITELENWLKVRMGDCAYLRDDGGRDVVTWKPTTSRRLDQRRLRDDHPDIADQYTTETVTRRFLVKTSGGD